MSQKSNGVEAVYTSTFTKGELDGEFHALDAEISHVAKSIDGCLDEESWEKPATGPISNVYYWRSLEALQQLVQRSTHLQAKRQQARWLNGYQVVIAQVLRSYGDGGIARPLMQERAT